jgi:hypothetical protein
MKIVSVVELTSNRYHSLERDGYSKITEATDERGISAFWFYQGDKIVMMLTGGNYEVTYDDN